MTPRPAPEHRGATRELPPCPLRVRSPCSPWFPFAVRLAGQRGVSELARALRPFSSLTTRGQARRLRGLAQEALASYGLDAPRLRLITNETNAIFRVEAADGARFVLRISSPAVCHTVDDTRVELAFLAHLQGNGMLRVPVAVPSARGEPVVVAAVPGVPEPRQCVLFRWIPGPVLGDRIDPASAGELGRTMARLHERAASFAPPSGLRIRSYDRVIPWADPEHPLHEPEVILDRLEREPSWRELRGVYARAIERVAAAIDALPGREPRLVIHNDLHPWNMKWRHGRLHLYDFEDVMRGHPVQDLGTAVYYLRRRPGPEALERALRAGYAEVAPWPVRDAAQLDAFVDGRALILVNFVLASETGHLRALAGEYVRKVAGRLG